MLRAIGLGVNSLKGCPAQNYLTKAVRHRLRVSWCTVLAQCRPSVFCAASIPVVGFNAILMSEHFGAFFAFAVLHAALAIRYIKVCPLPSTPRQPAFLCLPIWT